jgi:hypothetical protein
MFITIRRYQIKFDNNNYFNHGKSKEETSRKVRYQTGYKRIVSGRYLSQRNTYKKEGRTGKETS